MEPTELTRDVVAARRRRGAELLRASDAASATLAVLSSFNVDLAAPFLAEALDRAGVPAAVRIGPFGQIAQAVADPSSDALARSPQDVLIVPAAEDLLAPLFRGEIAADDPAAEALVDDRLEELAATVDGLLDRLPAATVHVVAFGPRDVPSPQILGAAGARGQQLVERLLAGVRALGERSPRVAVVDFDWHVRALGWAQISDDRLWYLGRMRLGPTGLAALAELAARAVAAARGHVRKVLVVDLDDTMWGGIVGEAGWNGVELGDEGVGLAFLDFQRELLKLRAGGVVLAVCSKNDHADALEVFDKRPEMLVKTEHLAAERINWADKASNLRELAAELSLGLDSFVFLDDNPVERRWVAEALPEVAVPELPADPALRPAFVRGLSYFGRLALTGADRTRSQTYAAERSRRELRTATASLDDFLRSLEQVATIEPVTAGTLPRAAQLCQRTNQFNLTTRRHSAADLERMQAGGDHELYTIALRDRLGDSGITGLAILRLDGDEAEIDTFLLSCRVLGRRVDDALLTFLATRAKARGARTLVGRRIVSKKNGQTERFYPDHGFDVAGDGVYTLRLDDRELSYPDQIDTEIAIHA